MITTGVPSGKTNKDIIYNLISFIFGGRSDDNPAGSNHPLNNKIKIIDEEFSSTFTLSQFHSDLMVLACEKFVKAYGVRKKSLGPKCKLFV